jgi:hypothetical protein
MEWLDATLVVLTFCIDELNLVWFSYKLVGLKFVVLLGSILFWF